MAFLIVLVMLLTVAVIVAAWQSYAYDFSEPPIKPEPKWERNTTALFEATNGKNND